MSIAASIIASTLNAGTPLLIAAAGIVIHEKSGVLNLGIEGIMLMGAVTGFTVTLSTGSFALGFLAGAGVGILLGLLFAFFTLGAQSVNPNIEVRVVWTSAWYDPGKESDAAKSLIGQGADVITHHTNSSAVASACEEAKIPVISYNTSMKRAAPTMLIGGVIHIWDEFYAGRIQAVMDGTWQPQSIWGGAPEHMIDLVDIKATDAVKADIKAAYDKMAAREFHPFTGPIVDNTGRQVLAEGQKATDADLLTMNWLAKGVAGKLPSGS